MKKGIYLQATVTPQDPDADPGGEAALREALEGAHDGVSVAIKRIRPADGAMQVILYLRGEQEPAADFAQWTTTVLRDLWDRTLGARWQLKELVERDDYVTEEEDDTEEREPAAVPAAAPARAAAAPDPSSAAAPKPARARPKARKLRGKKKHWPWRRKRPDK